MTDGIRPCRAGRGRSAGQVGLDGLFDQPEGAVETAGDLLGVVKRRVKGDLERFEEFIEARGAESGGWRGTIPNRDERRGI